VNEGAGGGKALRLLYVNSGLRRADIWTGVRARQLVDELVRQGASVSTFPHNTERHGREEDAAKQMGGLKDFVKDNFPAKLVLLFVEFWLTELVMRASSRDENMPLSSPREKVVSVGRRRGRSRLANSITTRPPGLVTRISSSTI
tara:strand:- start:106 stop:540 length:435 start_codon:yes stop_codon:yes gene_type:complete